MSTQMLAGTVFVIMSELLVFVEPRQLTHPFRDYDKSCVLDHQSDIAVRERRVLSSEGLKKTWCPTLERGSAET